MFIARAVYQKTCAVMNDSVVSNGAKDSSTALSVYKHPAPTRAVFQRPNFSFLCASFVFSVSLW